MKNQTPQGVRDFTPEQTKTHQHIQSVITGVFEAAGYEPVTTPLVEYESTLSAGLPKQLTDRAVRLVDGTGQVMLLRPDHTTPIARLAATQLQDAPQPLRLSYTGPVYHRQSDRVHDFEVFQAGVEYIGTDPNENADAHMIELLLQVLSALGLSDAIIDIGHVNFVSQATPHQRQALLSQQYIDSGIPLRGRGDLSASIPELATIMDRFADHPNVSLNQGLVKDLAYYTGIVFEAAVSGLGTPLATGGRYDDLMATFGAPRPAIGFSINVNALYHLWSAA